MECTHNLLIKTLGRGKICTHMLVVRSRRHGVVAFAVTCTLLPSYLLPGPKPEQLKTKNADKQTEKRGSNGRARRVYCKLAKAREGGGESRAGEEKVGRQEGGGKGRGGRAGGGRGRGRGRGGQRGAQRGCRKGGGWGEGNPQDASACGLGGF